MRRSFSRKRALNKQLLNAQLPPLPLPDAIPIDSHCVHDHAVVCARLSRVLHDALLRLDWPQVRFSDRTRLKRSLTLLAGDIPLVWLIAGQPLRELPQHVLPDHDKKD